MLTWEAARDYVEGMWLIMQHDTPDDFVLATGETHPVREFIEKAFGHVGITLRCVYDPPRGIHCLIGSLL